MCLHYKPAQCTHLLFCELSEEVVQAALKWLKNGVLPESPPAMEVPCGDTNAQWGYGMGETQPERQTHPSPPSHCFFTGVPRLYHGSIEHFSVMIINGCS